jgi:hypothetical protein
MARWTSSVDEVRHIARISAEMPIAGLVSLALRSGEFVEGVIVRSAQGNNGGRGGGWQYYGEVEVLMKDRSRAVIDYLDIKGATSAWSEEKSKEYEALGLIKVIDYPPGTIH